ncbi:MAG: HAD family hydrolase [Firmicutes bacterium]|nr:HAD family hydrolase [Bacillota bacterium]
MIRIGGREYRWAAVDMDGSNVNSVGIYGELHNEILGEYGHMLPCSSTQFWEEFFSVNPTAKFDDFLTHIINMFGLPLTLEQYKTKGKKRKHELLENVAYKPGADVFLAKLAERIPVALVTSSDMDDVSIIAKSPNIKNSAAPFETFAHIVTSEQVKKVKPFPHPYQMAMELMGASPDGTLVMEDVKTGLQSAIAADIPQDNIVIIQDEHSAHNEEYLRENGGLYILSHNELLELIEEV